MDGGEAELESQKDGRGERSERERGKREWATMPNEQERRRGSRAPSDEMR